MPWCFHITVDRKTFTNRGYGFIEIKKENEYRAFKTDFQPRGYCTLAAMQYHAVLHDFLLSDGWHRVNENRLHFLHYRMNRVSMLLCYRLAGC